MIAAVCSGAVIGFAGAGLLIAAAVVAPRFGPLVDAWLKRWDQQ